MIILIFLQFVGCTNNKNYNLSYKTNIRNYNKCYFLQNTKPILLSQCTKQYNQYMYFNDFLGFSFISKPIIGKDYYIGISTNGMISKIYIDNSQTIWVNKFFYKNQRLSCIDYLNGGIIKNKNRVFVTLGLNMLACIDTQTGHTIWKQELDHIITSYPIFRNNKIFIETHDNGLYSINADNGTILWAKSSLGNRLNVINTITLLTYKNMIITQDNSGNITAFNQETGLEEFHLDSHYITFDSLPNKTKILGYQPIIIDNFLYFFTSQGYFSKFDLLHKTIIWKRKININRPISISYNTAFVIDGKDHILAICLKTGITIWKKRLINYLSYDNKQKYKYWYSPVVDKDYVNLLSSKGDLIRLNIANGNLLDIQENI